MMHKVLQINEEHTHLHIFMINLSKPNNKLGNINVRTTTKKKKKKRVFH